MTRIQVAAAALGAVLLVGLVGCGTPGAAPTGGSTSAPSASPTAAATSGTPAPSATPAGPTPTATVAPAPLVVSKMLILPNFIGLYSADDVTVGSFDYFTPTANAVTVLTAHFGFAPVVAHIDADPNGDGHSYTSYDWSGFALHDWDGAASHDPYIPEFFINTTVREVGGVTVYTSGLVAVGDPTDATVAAYPAEAYTYSGQGGTQYSSIRVFSMEPVPGRYGPISLAVRLEGPVGGTIGLLVSPSPDMQM